MTIGSSYVGSITLKSSFAKSIGGILGRAIAEVEFTNLIARRCFFRAELEHPLHEKSPVIVLIISLPLRRECSSLLEGSLVCG